MNRGMLMDWEVPLWKIKEAVVHNMELITLQGFTLGKLEADELSVEALME